MPNAQQVDSKEATHIAVPVKLMDEVAALIASEVPWGKADSVMSQLKVAAKAITIEDKDDGRQHSE